MFLRLSLYPSGSSEAQTFVWLLVIPPALSFHMEFKFKAENYIQQTASYSSELPGSHTTVIRKQPPAVSTAQQAWGISSEAQKTPLTTRRAQLALVTLPR